MIDRRRLLSIVLLVALPIAAQSLWFYRGAYTPPDVPNIAEYTITLAAPTYQPATDAPRPGRGRVVIDLSHDNNLAVDDLNPLRDRLAVRGARVETFNGPDDELADALRRATAWVVVAPTTAYRPAQRDALVDFVADGGRVLIVADPTRAVPTRSADTFSTDPLELLSRASAVPVVNSLANAFGVVYFDDYLYNLNDNEGNYRNVRLTHFAEEQALTRDLEMVVFFAAHSLRSNGHTLISGDAQTRSPVRSGETDLTAAALSAGDQVLALGDLTFMTAPYNAIDSNDLFLSHIADWLSTDVRAWDVTEFPLLFSRPVDLVQAAGGNLDPRLIARSAALQTTLEDAGLTLDLRAAAQADHDALFVGTFDDADSVQTYLASAGISVTVSAGAKDRTSPTRETATPTPTRSATLTATLTLTATRAVTVTPTARSTSNAGKSSGTIEIDGMGTVPITGTTLFVVDRQADQTVLVALAEDGEAAIEALDRLADHDFSKCVRGDNVTVCSTGEGESDSGLGSGGASKPEATPQPERTPQPGDTPEPDAPKTDASILILARDNASEGERTSADDLASILQTAYTEVKVWSFKNDGVPESSDVEGYDAYVVESGDYVFDLEDIDSLLAMSSIQGRVMFIGAQPLPLIQGDAEPINDLVIADASHPLAEGLVLSEAIVLRPSESGVPSLVLSEDTLNTPGTDFSVVFKRGPDSPESDTPAVVAGENTGGDNERAIIATFAFYQLPDDLQRPFALNAMKWLLEEP